MTRQLGGGACNQRRDCSEPRGERGAEEGSRRGPKGGFSQPRADGGCSQTEERKKILPGPLLCSSSLAISFLSDFQVFVKGVSYARNISHLLSTNSALISLCFLLYQETALYVRKGILLASSQFHSS
jgi:hypothetical protein